MLIISCRSNKSDQYNRTETEDKMVQARTLPETYHIQGNWTHAYTENMNIMRQSENGTSDKCKCTNEAQNWEQKLPQDLGEESGNQTDFVVIRTQKTFTKWTYLHQHVITDKMINTL